MALSRPTWRVIAGANVLALSAALLPTVPAAAALPAPAVASASTPSGALRELLDTPGIDVPGFDEASFADPTVEKPAVLWFWDRPQTEAQVDARLESMHAAGFTETVIFRWFGDSSEPYFSQASFDRVEHLLSKSEELGMKVWLDDDAQFPSGAAGGLIVNGGTVGAKTYEPRPDLKVKTLRAAGSAARDGGRPIPLHDLFGSSVVLDEGEVVANAGSVPGITLLRDGAGWTDYNASAKFRIITATAGFMVRSPDPRNGYLVDVRADGAVDVWRQQNGGFSLVRQLTTPAGWVESPDKVHDIAMELVGSTLKITLDGVALDTVTGLSQFPVGRVGMRVDGNQHWRLSDLQVTSVPDGQTLFDNDFSDESSVSDFDTETVLLEDVVAVTARPATGPGATDVDEVVDITDSYLSDQGTWNAPVGRWRLEAYQSVARGGDRDSYVDSMSLEAQELYLDVVFDEYAERFEQYLGTTLVGFADDEPEVGRHGDDVPPWSPDLAERLTADGADLAKTVASVFNDLGDEGTQLRAQFYRSMSDQWNEAYWKTKYDWAEDHGVSVISNPLYDEYGPAGRLHESGNLMTMHQWAQVPGTDLIFDHVERGYVRNLPREPASVAHQLGRPLVYDELMGATGWDKTVADVRRGTAQSAVRGINKALFHATFDDNGPAPFPPVFADGNAWWKFQPELNTWTGRLMAFGRHQTAAPTALVQMQRAAEAAQRGDESAVDGPWRSAMLSLEDHQVDFDILDEGALSDDPANLAHAVVTPSGLQVGEMTYRTVVIPSAPVVSLEAMQRLRDFAAAGGEVVLAGPAPVREIEGRDAALATVVAELEAAGDHVVSTDDTAGAGPAAADLGRAAVTLATPNGQVRVLRFDEGDSTGYLLLNESRAAVSTDLTFPEAGVPTVWDVDEGTVEEATTYRVGAGTTTLPMTLQPNVPVGVTVSPGLTPSAHATGLVGRGEVDSVTATGDDVTVSVRSDRPGPVEVAATAGGIEPERTGVLTVPALPADKALGGPWQMQLDNGSGPVTRPLASWSDIAPSFSGDATYTRSFELSAADLDAEWRLELGNVANAAIVELNGHEVDQLVRAPYVVDLGDVLVEGTNTLRVSVTNTDGNSRGQVRTSGLLGPVALRSYAVVESTLVDSSVDITAASGALSADGASTTVTTTVTNTGPQAVRVRVSAFGDAWRGVPGGVVRVPSGADRTVVGHAVPTGFVDDGESAALVAQVIDAGDGDVLDLEGFDVTTEFATPPATAGDHVDLGDAASEAAHDLTASATSGTNTEAGLTRRFGGYRVPDAWYEFDLAAEPGQDLLVQGLETYNDMAQVKSYLVEVDGVLVATRSFNRPLTQEGTAAWRLLVPAARISGDTVRVRFQSRTNPDLADPSLADVWATPVAPFTAPGDVVTVDEAPRVAGVAALARKLTATSGEWNLEGLIYGYRWTRDGVPIARATAASYVVQAGDIGKRLGVTVTATHSSGTTGQANSAATAVVPKVATRTILKAGKAKVKAGQTVMLRIAVAPLTKGVVPAGTAQVRVNGRLVRTVAVRHGAARLDLRLRGKGVKKITVVYLGSSKLVRSTSRVVKVRVAKRSRR